MLEQIFHSHLRKSSSWYDSWHNHPRHQHTHWMLFLIFSMLTFSSLSGEIGRLYYEYELKAEAATLNRSGDRFTIDGSQQFLIFISYFDAMAASNATLDSDFAALRSRGFNGIRMFPNWNPRDNPYQLMDSAGNLRSGRMDALRNIIQRADANGLIVDVSFTRDTVSGMSPDGLINGLEQVTRELMPYRNLFYDLTNEADHDGTDCATARLCPEDARRARDAVKAIDPQRIVGVSANSDSGAIVEYTLNGGMDIVLPHRSLGPLDGSAAFIIDQKSVTPGLPAHFQEPARCRTNPCEYSVTEYLNSARDTKCAGGAGWNFHTSAGYDLANNSLFDSWLDPNTENAVASQLAGALSGISWGSCSSGGTNPTPTPTTSTSPVTITSISPNSGTEGTAVVITGTNLDQCEPLTLGGGIPTDACNVSFYDFRGNQGTVSGRTTSPTTVTATLPFGMCTGAGTVRVSLPGTPSNTLPFNIISGSGTDCIPISRFIYYIYPNKAPAGAPITIAGENLSSTVHFYNADGAETIVEGSISWVLNNINVHTAVSIPTELAPGSYTVRVGSGSGDLSNAFPITVTPDTYIPNPAPTDPPVVTGIDPATVNQGGTIQIYGDNLPQTATFIDASGQTTTVLGWVNSEFDVLTVGIPANFTPGQYTVGVTGPNGSATSPTTLTVIAGTTEVTAAATGIVIPQSTTTFNRLISSSLDYAVYALGLAVFVVMLYAGFLWITSAANPGNIALAKRYMTNAIIGAVLLLSSYIILYTINPDLVGGTLTLPGITPQPTTTAPTPTQGGNTSCNQSFGLTPTVGCPTLSDCIDVSSYTPTHGCESSGGVCRFSNNPGTTGTSAANRLQNFINTFNGLAGGSCSLRLSSTIQGPSGPSISNCHQQGTGNSGTCADFNILPGYSTQCRDFFYQAARNSGAVVSFLNEYDSACTPTHATGGNVHVNF